ncbi:MAG: hydantoinase B/oxoprolinase family protein, partial [Nannocystaceae bacterium]
EEGFAHVTASHELYSGAGMLARGDTAATSAYLTPLLDHYLQSIAASLPGSSLQLMASSGRLQRATHLSGQDAVYSGPAGGVVACAHIARSLGLEQVIGFDMGGTSTDVYRYAGALERRSEHVVDGVKIRASMLKIDTVAAGGGSICALSRQRLTVGPESAGAHPGPLCYGDPEADALTLTDVNLYLGRLCPERFPIPLHTAPVEDALRSMRATLAARGIDRELDALACGFLQVANVHAAQAIRRAVLEDGYDLRDHDLIVFGGAGGQHACAVADELGIRRFFVHPLASLLSAWGIGLAREGWNGAADLGNLPLSRCEAPLAAAVDALTRQGAETMALDPEVLTVISHAVLQTSGTETSVPVLVGSSASMKTAFFTEHERRFGFLREDAPIEVLEVRVEVLGPRPSDYLSPRDTRDADANASSRQEVWTEAYGRTMVDVIDRRALMHQPPKDGPCLVVDVQRSRALDPVLLEVFAHRFMAIATHMGDVLRRTAMSTNIRDRLDFSCALFDANAGLVANAPHIPVHLGAMAESVASVARSHPHPLPGDAFVTNDPARGGSHLPDITVVTPMHDDDGEVRFWVASRGHHAEIGGVTPGSMPPFSTRLEQEGVVLRDLLLTREGTLRRDALLEVLQGGDHPSRAPAENLADLEAQLAANRRGVELLETLCDSYGVDVVEAYMGHIQEDARLAVAAAIESLPDGTSSASEHLDDGTEIAVRIDVDGGSMVIDFDGTAPAHAGNLNAPRAVTLACVLYVLRTLVGKPIPLNQGCLTPVEVRLPPGSLLDPPATAAVAAGNVETSQRIVDLLLRALGVAASSQGTMNNLSF